jgi:hypothetical protein
MCYPIAFQSGEVVFGVPIGACVDAGSEVNVGLWDNCDMGNDLCPEGSFCFPTDTTDMSSHARCMPFCYTEAPTPCPTQAGVPTDVECFSMSAWFRPGSSQGQVGDEGSPSTLGLCACPEGGCTGVTTCGNDTIDTGEVCDGSALGGETCENNGFSGGTLACSATCDATDASGCTP